MPGASAAVQDAACAAAWRQLVDGQLRLVRKQAQAGREAGPPPRHRRRRGATSGWVVKATLLTASTSCCVWRAVSSRTTARADQQGRRDRRSSARCSPVRPRYTRRGSVTGKRDSARIGPRPWQLDFWHGPCKKPGRRCAMVRRLVVAAVVLALAGTALARDLTAPTSSPRSRTSRGGRDRLAHRPDALQPAEPRADGQDRLPADRAGQQQRGPDGRPSIAAVGDPQPLGRARTQRLRRARPDRCPAGLRGFDRELVPERLGTRPATSRCSPATTPSTRWGAGRVRSGLRGVPREPWSRIRVHRVPAAAHRRSEFITSIGVASWTGAWVTARVDLQDTSGNVVHNYELPVPPYGHVQGRIPVGLKGGTAGGLHRLTARTTRWSYPYATVRSAITGDPTTIEAQISTVGSRRRPHRCGRPPARGRRDPVPGFSVQRLKQRAE